MPNKNRLRIFYFSHLSTPPSNRLIYRAILRHQTRKIVELGIGTGARAGRMIEVAAQHYPRPQIELTAIDPFEARSAADGPGVSLKKAHRLFRATGAHVRLVPGDPLAGLARVANALGQVDLLVVSARLDPQSMARAWFYVPRLLHERSEVFLETLHAAGRTSVRPVSRAEVENLANAGTRRRAA